MLSDEKLTELRSKYGLLPLMALLRAVAEAAVQEDRKSGHLKERAQLEAEWSQLRAMTAAVQDSTTRHMLAAKREGHLCITLIWRP